MNTDAFIITGPTASGKSDFAHSLARRVGGVVINCDSVQIYRGIENISASPLADMPMVDGCIDGVPYELFSVLPLSRQLSVCEYMDMARDAYARARAAGRPAVFVGGTGYYINAILNGISPMPDIDADVRMRARNMVDADINTAKQMLGPNAPRDPQRVARALEVFLQTGRYITEFQAAPRIGAITPRPCVVLINPDAAVLKSRIVARIPKMIDAGALDEAQRIIDNNWDPSRAIGAVQACAYLRGDISRDECIKNWITKTRQYAKRQRTWFRTQFTADIEINQTPTDADVDAVIGNN